MRDGFLTDPPNGVTRCAWIRTLGEVEFVFLENLIWDPIFLRAPSPDIDEPPGVFQNF